MLPTRRDGTMRKRVGFGTDRAQQLNPLLSVVEDWMSVPGGYVEHLHRGFESVTLVFDGAVRCAHASGESELLTAGDVQWVTAGRGVMHAELPEGEGEAHLIQLWLNLPAAQKLCPPRTLTLRSGQVPVAASPGAQVRVICGELSGQRGAATAAAGARLLDCRLEPGAALTLPIAASQLGFVYVASGELEIAGHAAIAGDLVHFQSKISDALQLTASTSAHLVVLSAPPLAEPVIVNGPFIMNSASQIQEAYAEFRAGTFAQPVAERLTTV